MKHETCCVCDMQFSIPDNVYKARLDDGKSFYCPNGHAQYYTKAIIPGLQKRIRDLTASLNAKESNRFHWKTKAEQLARRLSATKGVVTKLRKQYLKKGKK